jgi:hypothetical protein
MLNDIKKFAEWLVFGPDAGDEDHADGFVEATIDDSSNYRYTHTPNSHHSTLARRTVSQEQKALDRSGGGLIDLQCGGRVFNDAPAKMRTELWMSKLHSSSKDGGKTSAAVYQEYLGVTVDESVLSEIDKDTHRTFPGHVTLSSKSGQNAMYNVLRAYAAFDPEVGYSQGMNFLVGMLLTYLSPPEAFAALRLVMRERELREFYKPNGMVHLQARLWQLSKLIPEDLEAHLERHMVLPVLYASSWFLTCFASEFPIKFAARVMDVIITDSYHLPIMKVSLKILTRCKDDILELEDMEDIIDLLRKQVPSWPESTLQDLLTSSLGSPWSQGQMEILQNSNAMAETVAEAMNRICKSGDQEQNNDIDSIPSWVPEWSEPQESLKNMGDLLDFNTSIIQNECAPVAASSSAMESPFSSSQLNPAGDSSQIRTISDFDPSGSSNITLKQQASSEQYNWPMSYQNSMRELLNTFSVDKSQVSIENVRDWVMSQSINWNKDPKQPQSEAPPQDEFGEWQTS